MDVLHTIDLDARSLKVRIEDRHGDLVLVLEDGEGTEIVVNPGAGGSRMDAVRGADNLARESLRFALSLDERAKRG